MPEEPKAIRKAKRIAKKQTKRVKASAKPVKSVNKHNKLSGNKALYTSTVKENAIGSKKILVNPLENIEYTDKVKDQMKLGDYHSFPESVDAFGAYGKISKIKGEDGIIRTKVEIQGGYRNKEGVFEYIIEPDGKTVNHRLFRPRQDRR